MSSLRDSRRFRELCGLSKVWQKPGVWLRGGAVCDVMSAPHFYAKESLHVKLLPTMCCFIPVAHVPKDRWGNRGGKLSSVLHWGSDSLVCFGMFSVEATGHSHHPVVLFFFDRIFFTIDLRWGELHVRHRLMFSMHSKVEYIHCN